MCGIAGLVHGDAASSLGGVERMLSSIRHRGRDGAATWAGDGVILGHNRLSIIDLSPTGAQPMANSTGTVWVVCNGEIYNYRELREALIARGHRFRGSSDTEVIPHLYEEYGEDFAPHLRGMFALALWDQTQRRLILARDRAGKKPLFYAEVAGGFAFASEMKALFCLPGVDLRIRDQGIHDYLTYGVIPGNETIYRGIFRVAPAHLLIREAGGAMSCRRYWRLGFHPKLDISREEAKEEILRRLRDAVAIRLRSDVPVGVFLSGGIDSGLITALAAQELGTKLKTFTIGFVDAAFDERPLARQVAERYDTDHTEFVLESILGDDLQSIIRHYDDPFSAPSALPSFAVARLAGAEVKVVLNGDGADEIFCGYRHFVAARLIGRLQAVGVDALRPLWRVLHATLPAPRRGRGRYQFLHRFLRALGETGAGRYLALTTDRLNEHEKAFLYGGEAPFGDRPIRSSLRFIDDLDDECVALGPIDSTMLRDYRQMLPDDHLVKMDIATMASTLEARSPFLDHELGEFVARLPESYRLDGPLTKPLLREIAAPLLPESVVTARKRGFEIPLLRWMRGDLNSLMRNLVLDPGSYARNHFDRRRLELLVEGRGWDAKRWSSIVWTLMCLEIWWDNYRGNIVTMATRGEKSTGAGVSALATTAW